MKLLGAALIRGRRLLEEGTYLKIREMNNINCQNPVIFLNIRIKYKFSLSINQIQ